MRAIATLLPPLLLLRAAFLELASWLRVMFRSASKFIEQPKYLTHYKMQRGQRLSVGCNKGKEGDGEEKREGAGRPSYAFRDTVKISGVGN